MENNPSIFRPEAVEHYLNKRERSVFPVYATPRTALCAVLLFVVLSAGVLLAVSIRVPVYARGAAVLIEQAEGATSSSGTVEVAIFVPAEILSRMEVGQKVFLRDGAMGWRVGGRIKAFGSDVMPSSDTLARFRTAALPDGVSKELAAVALVEPLPSGLATWNERDDVFEVSVEIGERRLLPSQLKSQR